MQEVKIEGEQTKLSPGRALTALYSLLSALLAIALGFYFEPKHGQEDETISSFSAVPWWPALLLAYGFGSILVFLGVGDPKQPLIPTLKIWALLLVLFGLIWFVPLLFSVGRFSWSQSVSISLTITIIGSLPLASFKKGKTDSK